MTLSNRDQVIEKLRGLIGSTIVHIDAVESDGQAWPVFVVENMRSQTFQLEIASDAEGNGPGHVFVGMLHGDDLDDCLEINDESSWELVDRM